MTRPRKSEHTREKLLEEGMAILSEHGYHGTGLKKILDTVKVPKGSFYNYFKSKEVFVSEIIRRYNLDVITILDTYIDSSDDDPLTMLRTVYEIIIIKLETQGMKGCLVGNMAAEIGNISEACQTEMQHAIGAWQNRLETLIEKGQNQNLFRKDLSASVMADILWSTWQGGLLKMKIDGNTTHLKQIVRVMLDSLFRPDSDPERRHEGRITGTTE